MKKILYIGWLGFNNLGDELMWELFRELSEKYLDPTKFQVIPSLSGVNLKDLTPYDVVVLGGGSLIIPGYIDVLHQAVKDRKKAMIWGSGHDRLEPIVVNHQGKILSDLVGHENSRSVMLKEILQDIDFCGIRGPLTYQYLEQLSVPMDRVRISGDPGYLLPLPHSEQVEGKDTKPIIGINWGTTYNKIYGRNEMFVEDALVRAAQRFIEEGYKIYLYPVWGPDRSALKRLYEKIGEPDQTILDLELHNYQELMNIVQGFTMTVNFKLHANILSAAAGVPFLCLGYRFKCLDFVHSFNLPDSIVLTDSPNLEEDMIKAMFHIHAHRLDIIASIKEHQVKYKKILETPFTQQLF